MKRLNRWQSFVALFLGFVLIMTLVAAPSSSKNNSGSTYGRAPNGYGAWYTFMQQQGVNVQRWQKPFADLSSQESPITLLQVRSYLSFQSLSAKEREWIEKGNNLVVLGIRQNVSGAEFSTIQKSPMGNVKIETRRRREVKTGETVELGDSFGAIIWQKKYGKGKAIFATTTYLGANAYKDEPGNFKYLANLVKYPNHPILVDEYIHGYKDG